MIIIISIIWIEKLKILLNFHNLFFSQLTAT